MLRGFGSSGLRIGAAVLCLVTFLLGCATRPVVPQSTARSQLSEAESLLRRGDAQKALAAYDRALDDALRQRDLQSEILATLGRADCKLRTGDRTGARADASRAASRAGMAPIEVRYEVERRAEILLGDADLEGGNAAAAREHYRAALAKSPSGSAADPILYRLVVCARRLGQEGEAADLNGRILDPGSPALAALRERFPDLRKPAAKSPAAATAEAPPTSSGVPILPRSRWGAAPIKGNKDPMSKIRRVTVHHSATEFAATSLPTVAAHIRGIQRYHQGDQKWADIGYHYVIDGAGRIWEGRPIAWQGAHAGNSSLNQGNIGIVLLGDFRRQQLPAVQKDALIDLLDECCTRYGIAKAQVLTHQEIRENTGNGTSECPGSRITDVVRGYRKDRASGATARAAVLKKK